jgi:hypothetical protein
MSHLLPTNPEGGTTTTNSIRFTVLLLSVLFLSACGSGGARGLSGVAGDYTCTDSLLETMKLTSSGKVYATMMLLGQKMEKAGTYEVDGAKVTVKLDTPTVFTRSGNTLDAGFSGKCTKR